MNAPARKDERSSVKLLAFEPPPHWQIKPLRYLFEAVGGATPSKDNFAFWDGTIPWVSPKDMKTDVITDSEDHISETAIRGNRLALLPPSTVLIVVRGMILARSIPIAVTAVEATINQDMKGLFPKKGVTSEYLAQLLRAVSPALFSTIEESGHGTCCLRLDLWRNILVGVPPEAEQRAIVSLVGEQSAYIDSLIAKKQQQIRLLGEKQQALISQAITKNLDPTAHRKPSGIPWLGDIPTHWGVKRAKYLFTQSRLPVRDDDEIVTAFRDGQVTLRSNRRSEGYTFAVLEQGYQGVRSGQLVIHSMDAFAGAIGVSESDGKCTPEYVVCDAVRSKCSMPYYAFLLREMARRKFIEVSCLAVRERAPRFRFSSFSEMYLPLPPIAEQDEIVRLIEIESNRLVPMRRLLTKQIERLTEYRQTLISAAVTGKIAIGEKKQAGQEVVTAKTTAKANPYFRRTVFAAAIIDRLCAEPTFGHVKFQKCIYVAQHHLQVADFKENYKRAAAGPYDNRLVRSIDSQLERQRWFRAKQVGDRYAYHRLEKAGGHQKYFEGYFGDRADQLTWLLDLFRPMNTDQAEIVATLYAVWNDFLIRGEKFADDRLVEEVLTNWDDTKKRFEAERWHRAIVWMREKGLVPSGFGKPTNADTSGN